MQRDELDIGPPYAAGKTLTDFGQGNHRMPVRSRRHVVDEVDNAVFQAAGVETEDHVDDQRGGSRH